MTIKYLEIPTFTLSSKHLTQKYTDEKGNPATKIYQFEFLAYCALLLADSWWRSGTTNEAEMRSGAALRLSELFEEADEKKHRVVPVEDADLAMLIERAQLWEPPGDLVVFKTKVLKFFRVLLSASTKPPASTSVEKTNGAVSAEPS